MLVKKESIKYVCLQLSWNISKVLRTQSIIGFSFLSNPTKITSICFSVAKARSPRIPWVIISIPTSMKNLVNFGRNRVFFKISSKKNYLNEVIL